MTRLGKTSVLGGILALWGCQAANAWIITQNFDNQADGAGCANWDAAGNSKVSSLKAYSGSKSCQLSITQGDTAFGTWGGIINHPTPVRKGGELWFRVRTFMPAGFNYDGGPFLKFLRVHTMSDTVSNYGYDDIYINNKGSNNPFQFIYESEQVWDMIGTLTGTLQNVLSGAGPSSQAIQLGTWETYEYYVKFDTAPVTRGGTARVLFWKSGVLMADIKDRITLQTADAYSDRTHLFTYWNGGSPATQQMYVDDVVLTTDTPAGRDAAGNPYIGVGGAAPPVTPIIPKAPTSVSVQ